MLPPGHIAAGFLTAEALLKIAHPQITQTQQNQLLWWGMFFGFAPDLDYFIGFIREHAWFIKQQRNNHRKFISHAPILWLIAGLAIYFLSVDTYWKLVGLLLWLASWSHFLLDSIEYGIMWLWPFSSEIYALRNKEKDLKSRDNNFLDFWITFVKSYTKTVTFYCEVIIIILALILFFTKY
jgi:membrane-bound metal-dependent hydrolase YbcI (DUF457 family)